MKLSGITSKERFKTCTFFFFFFFFNRHAVFVFSKEKEILACIIN